MMTESKAFIQKNTIDTTGAGDTFYGCVLHYICESGISALTKKTITEMLSFANAAASLITTKKGALSVMPDKSEVESLLEKYEIRK